MQDAFGVRGIERIGDLRADVEHLAQVERFAQQPPIERIAVEQFHRQIQLPLVFVEAVDGADVGVIERRRGARLAAEALHGFLVRGAAGRQHLEGDLAPEFQVLRAVHHAHPASAQLVEDAIVPEDLSF